MFLIMNVVSLFIVILHYGLTVTHWSSLVQCFGWLALPLLFFYDHGEVRYIELVEVKFRHQRWDLILFFLFSGEDSIWERRVLDQIFAELGPLWLWSRIGGFHGNSRQVFHNPNVFASYHRRSYHRRTENKSQSWLEGGGLEDCGCGF